MHDVILFAVFFLKASLITQSDESLYLQIYLSIYKGVFPPFESFHIISDLKYFTISAVVSDYRVVVYNVFIQRGNVGVLTCSVPAPVRDWVEVLGWWRILDKEAAREEIHSGGRYLVTTAGQ